MATAEVVLSARDLTVGFGDNVILDKLELDIKRGEILGFVGASGAGKSVLLRTILGLIRKRSGTIKLFGVDVEKVERGASACGSTCGSACCSSMARCFRR